VPAEPASTDDPVVRALHRADEERRALGRDLHDGPQQRLVALGHLLTLAAKRLGSDADPAALDLLARARDEAAQTTAELRALARGLHPAGLAERGLPAALEALAERSPVPVALSGLPDRRLPSPVEVTVYAVVAEALSNAAKHAHATGASVVLADHGSSLHVAISDDGVGGASADLGGGLAGLRDRVRSLGGTLVVDDVDPHGTRVGAVLPLATWRTAFEPRMDFGAEGDGGAGERELQRVLSGEKTVSLGVVREWDLEGGPPRPGQRLPCRDQHGRTRGTIEITRSTIVRLEDVTPDLVRGARLGHPTFEAWLEAAREEFVALAPGLRRLLGDPTWWLGPQELVVVHRFRVI
jgi:uncharacterized protein YhfF